MAMNLLMLKPTTIRPSASLDPRKPDPNYNKNSSNWWTPLFGWSSEPDYIGSSDDCVNNNKAAAGIRCRSESDVGSKPARSRLAPGCFTEEKARQLRMSTPETFHDAMYHSAIASRLASDFKKHSDL